MKLGAAAGKGLGTHEVRGGGVVGMGGEEGIPHTIYTFEFSFGGYAMRL